MGFIMEISKEELKEILSEVLHENRKITDNLHQEDHDFVQILKEERRIRHERWEKFEKSLIGGAAIAFLGFLGWIGTIILEHLPHIGK